MTDHAEAATDILDGLPFEDFRQIMGSFASGIAVVTTIGADGDPYGLTCSAVCSVSADPPLLLSCVKPRAGRWTRSEFATVSR